MLPDLITVRALAELMGWSEHTIYQRRYRGDSLPRGLKLGNGSLRFRTSDVEQWIDQHTEANHAGEWD